MEVLTWMQSGLKDCDSVILYMDLSAMLNGSFCKVRSVVNSSSLSFVMWHDLFESYTPLTYVVKSSCPHYPDRETGALHACS